MKKVLL